MPPRGAWALCVQFLVQLLVGKGVAGIRCIQLTCVHLAAKVSECVWPLT